MKCRIIDIIKELETTGINIYNNKNLLLGYLETMPENLILNLPLYSAL